MLDLLTRLLGRYTFESFSLVLTFVESQLCISLFASHLQKRVFFVLRLLLSELEGIVLCFLLAILNTEVNTLLVRVLCYLTITFFNIGFLAFCWQDSAEAVLLTFCAGMAAYQLTNKLYPLIQNLLGINDRATISLFHGAESLASGWEWGLFFGLHLLSFLLLSRVFRPRSRLSRDKRTSRSVVLLSIITVATVNILICIARAFEAESMTLNIVIKVFCVVFGFFVLIICAGIFSVNDKEQQINVLNQLMKQEKLQLESVKANMDVINMKCHDLKHIIGKIEDKLTAEETDSLREAIKFYDANINTGNEVLDVVLCEKAMLCEKNGIRFSCMADGTAVSFLPAVQLYSLFGNIIDNAVEAVGKLQEQEKKVISLVCGKDEHCAFLEESNYFSGQLPLSKGLPETSKEDSSRHGYGIKSIRYIAEQYGGSIEIQTEEQMFFLRVRFPRKT